MAEFRLICPEESLEFNFTGLNSTNVTIDRTDGHKVLNVFQYGTLSGLMIVLILDVLTYEGSKRGPPALKNALIKLATTEAIIKTFVLTVLVFVLPIIIAFLLLTYMYKVLCSVIIRREDKHFVGFLDSFDVFWHLESDSSKSIINVLGVIESNSPHMLAEDIKIKLHNIWPDKATKKIFYRRKEQYGFYYWRRHSFIDMNEYVEVIGIPNKKNLNVTDLEDLMSDVQNQSLPYEDEGLFKILITEQRVGNYEDERGDYGIIFRIHHSVGDGVALVEFLCRTLADSHQGPVNMFSFPMEISKQSPQYILDTMRKLCQIPKCAIDGALRKSDVSVLHGPPLLGKKFFKFTASDENLLGLVKDLKNSVESYNFSDILLAGLVSGLQNFLLKKMAPIPEDVAVILPVRFPKVIANGHDLEMANDFSVTILDLPMRKNNNVEEVNNRCMELRRSADPLANYFLLKIACNVLPNPILKPLLNSNQATMVFSNLPGPDTLTICGGNTLKSLVFFVPHKGNTGLGVTALCYGNVLRLAAMGDAALVSSSDDLMLILDGMVDEIKRLHQLYVK